MVKGGVLTSLRCHLLESSPETTFSYLLYAIGELLRPTSLISMNTDIEPTLSSPLNLIVNGNSKLAVLSHSGQWEAFKCSPCIVNQKYRWVRLNLQLGEEAKVDDFPSPWTETLDELKCTLFHHISPPILVITSLMHQDCKPLCTAERRKDQG